MTNYSFSLQWSDEDAGYIARCPEFPGLSAFGESPGEAIAEAQIALELMVETYQESDQSLPEARKIEHYSGQFRVRIPKSLHREAVELAEQEGVSLNTLVATSIAEKVGAGRRPKLPEKITLEIQLASVPTKANSLLRLNIGELGALQSASTTNWPEHIDIT